MKIKIEIVFLTFLIALGSLILIYQKKISFSLRQFLASPSDLFKIEIVGDGGFGNSLALNSKGEPAISFTDKEKGLIFTQKINNQWIEEIVDTRALAGNATSLAFDREGRPNILYIDKSFSLKLAKKENQNWKIEKIFNGGALSCSLVFDKEGKANISFWNSSKGALAFGKRVKNKWQIEIVDSGEVGWWNDLVLDGNQNPHISYFDFKNKDLLYVFFDGKKWQKEIVDFEGDVGSWNSIVIDKENYPHISYFDEGNGDLKYAKRGEGGWEIEKVDFKGLVGERSNLILGEDEIPLISYFDIEKGDFKLAKKIGNRWQIQILDFKGKVGGDNSLFFDKKGKLHLIWQDLILERLKYSNLFLP